MKLIRFTTQDSSQAHFGCLIKGYAVPFAALQSRMGQNSPHLADSRSYLSHLPHSENAARELVGWGEQNLDRLTAKERFAPGDVRLLEPVEVAALFDFGLTPRHLKNSIETVGKYERHDPQMAALLQAFSKVLLAPKTPTPAGQPEPLSY